MFTEKLTQNETELLTYEFDDIDVKSLVQLAQYISSEHHRPCVLLAKLFDKCHVAVAAPKDSDGDCKALFKELAERFELNGGGNEWLSQGGGVYTKALSDYVKAIQKI